jgi:anti-sigma28 factor (negative regulator of flagellin synthesis)
MKINGQQNEVLRPAAPAPAGGVHGPKRRSGAEAPSTPTPRSDSVQISDAGRALSTGETAGAQSLSPARVAALRKRVLEGAYDATHVVDQVARQILDRGDV